MSSVEGKNFLASSIVAFSFSFIGFILFAFLAYTLSLDDGYYSFKEFYLEIRPYALFTEVRSIFHIFQVLFDIGLYSNFFLLIIDTTILILVITRNQFNRKVFGIIFMVDSVLHVLVLRILSFYLLLNTGRKVYQREITIEGE